MSLGEKAERDARAERTKRLCKEKKIMTKITWKKCDGRYICVAKMCRQWTAKGCKLRKVSLTCDNGECQFNVSPVPGIYQCGCMDVHLNADGKCLGSKEK